MHHYKGIICEVIPCSGCLEVTVAGARPGTFVIDNCCAWAIVDMEGSHWIGRPVEYRNGCMRFLDLSAKRSADASPPASPAISSSCTSI